MPPGLGNQMFGKGSRRCKQLTGCIYREAATSKSRPHIFDTGSMEHSGPNLKVGDGSIALPDEEAYPDDEADDGEVDGGVHPPEDRVPPKVPPVHLVRFLLRLCLFILLLLLKLQRKESACDSAPPGWRQLDLSTMGRERLTCMLVQWTVC